jgi:hypothetical protein
MGDPFEVPPTRPSTPVFNHPVPPTRPSTPTFGRIDRIAEAPSRADHNLPPVETSSPIQAPPFPMDFSEPAHVNSNHAGDDIAHPNEQNGHDTASTPAVSPQIISMDIYLLLRFLDRVIFASQCLLFDSCYPTPFSPSQTAFRVPLPVA